jgi:chromosome segregation ATPase
MAIGSGWMIMEKDQLEKKIAWLDDERRKEHESLEALGKRLLDAEDALEEQSKRLEDVGSEMARLSALATAVSKFDESLHKHRQEVSRQLEESQGRREQQAKEAGEIRRGDHDALNKRITELRSKVDSLTSLEEALENRRMEEVKLSRELNSLDKRLRDYQDQAGDVTRRMETYQDSRQGDGKRIAEMQSEVSSLRNSLEKQRGSQDIFDDRSRRLETQISELNAAESERRETLEAWTENQIRKLAGFERKWNEWEDRFASFEKMASELDERMIQYEETFLSTKQLQSELETTLERLERRIHEVGEIQRLSENRQKQEWSIFSADEQKRWNTFKLTNEEQWREHERVHDKLAKIVETLVSDSEASQREQEKVIAGIEDRVKGLLRLARDWADDIETE